MRRTVVVAGCAALLASVVVADAARQPPGTSEPTWPLAHTSDYPDGAIRGQLKRG